ncbi:serine/threonine-protein kinase [Stratiformator vulcanicus]|uniref:non-specific serine/threonine protein kinase n=1 Tax=Stratiformator vulcanicus TaxID=2527980 RepID=A0A517R4N2_9PLAN|nr:serine/threonine-protein kinase [Stratiformator vulcanicus]QDT38844.1 Serine/threonine-protein kinase PrkC [Stratiformator vulcanicus]
MSTEPKETAVDPDSTYVPERTPDADRDQTQLDSPGQNAGGQQSRPSSKPQAGKSPAGAPKKVTKLGDFQLVKKLGQGGMGTVYLAKQVSLDRKVAIKTLSKELAKRTDFVGRFLREARSMAKLDHPNIVKVFAADTVRGMNFVAIEYVDGCSMQDWMDKLGKLSQADALCVTLVVGEALKHAHEINMIHRDIKPDNILVTKRGVIKVADFGLAKAVDEDQSLTASGIGLGTPLYMPPEQARNAKHVDQRTDIYALGCTLYYMLVGKLPFTAENTIELITLKETATFPSARKMNPEIPERLDLMIDKSMAKEADHRYQTVDEFLTDLRKLDLAGVELSFIDDALPASFAGTGAVTAIPKSKTKRMSKPADSRADAVKKSVTSAKGQFWEVSYRNKEGKPVTSKMTTEQVIRGLKGNLLDLQSKARKSKDGSFLPLAQFNEFEAIANSRAAHDVAGKKSVGMAAEIARLERKRLWQQRLKPITNLFQGMKGLLSLLLWLAIVFGGIGAVVYFGWGYVQPYLPGAATSAPTSTPDAPDAQ